MAPFWINGGPSREDLFDNFRLATRDRMLAVSFKSDNDYPSITIGQIHGIERVNKNRFATSHDEWIITSEETQLPKEYRKPAREDMFHPYRIKILYNTKTRTGYATIKPA